MNYFIPNAKLHTSKFTLASHGFAASATAGLSCFGRVSTWMADRLRVDKPKSTQPTIPPG